MCVRFRISSIVRLAFGLLASGGCSNGANESPPIATPTPVDAQPSAPTQSPPVEPPDEAAPDRPPRKRPSRRQDDGERLNPEIAGLGTEVLLAAFPERMGAWVRESANAHPAGSAGRWADGASAVYRDGRHEIRVEVTDMIRVNACTPGTGAAIREESKAAEPDSKLVTLSKYPAVLVSRSSGAEVGLWLGDRCQLGLSTTDATGDDLVTLGWGMVGALAAACSRRDPVGPLGR